MAEKRIHVVPQGDQGWTWHHEGGKAEGRFSSAREAEQAAKEHARAHGDHEVVIHGRDGRIRDSDTMDRSHEGPARDTVR